eukprot:7243304-Pyramimonas_sp.AAC.1
MASLARLVRLLLSPRSVSDKKLRRGDELEILVLHVSCSHSKITLFPAPKKVCNWLFLMSLALNYGKVRAGQASKLAGALSWARQHCSGKLGRAMLHALLAQQSARRGV